MTAGLVDWKERRNNRRAENHWKAIAEQRTLTPNEEYQRLWNFIETDYGERPSANGLDRANPAFAYTTNLARYIQT